MTDTSSEPKLIASTVSALPASAAERFGECVAARYKDGDEWHDLSYAEAGKAIEEIALGLVALGIEPVADPEPAVAHLGGAERVVEP